MSSEETPSQNANPPQKNLTFSSPTELSCYVALSGVESRHPPERLQQAVLPVPGAASKRSSSPCPDPLPAVIRPMWAVHRPHLRRHPARPVPASNRDRTGYRFISGHPFRSSSRSAGRRQQWRQLGPRHSYLRRRLRLREFPHPATVPNISSRPKGSFLCSPKNSHANSLRKSHVRYRRTNYTKHMLSSNSNWFYGYEFWC